MKFCILLTASINPPNTIGLKRNSTIDREADYYQALMFYSKFGIPIVFCDNSMFDSEKINEFCRKNRQSVEFLSFPSKHSHLGKSHGEKEIFDHAHAHSVFIREATHVIKITGRLMLENFEKMYRTISVRDCEVMTNLSRNLSFADSRFFVYRKEYYPEYLEPVLSAQLNDSQRFYFERCLARSIHKMMSEKDGFYLLPFYPSFIGYNGTTNRSYRKSFLDRLKYNFYHRVKSYVFSSPV